MDSGVLQFSLGLATGGFLSPLNSTMSRLTGFIGGMVSLGAITEGVMSAIERGAALEHLSKRTNTSVADLFKLQKGFKAVGMDADAVGPILFKMQKALGGVNEFGVDTRSIFHRMGLEIETLKKMSAPQQLAAIAGALGKLNTTSAASAAGGIFGREGAGQMVQLSHSTGEFAEAMRKAARDADNMQRNAAGFARLQRGLDEIKGNVQNLFSGIAEGLAPGIQSIEDLLNGMDLSQLGEKIGKVFGAFVEAFREGKLTELLVLSFTTGNEAWRAMLPGIFETIGYGLLKAFETPLIYLQAGMEYAIESACNKFATNKYFKAFLQAAAPGAASVLGAIGDTGKPDWQKTLNDRKDSGLEIGMVKLDDIKNQANSDLQAGLAKMKAIGAPLMGMIDGLDATARKRLKGGAAGAGGKNADSLEAASNHYKPEATSLEKMGFVMGGGSSPILELNRRTATGVEKTVTLLGKISGQLSGAFGGAATNQL